MVLALNISPLATVPLLFFACQNSVAVFLLPFVDLIILHGRRRQPRQVRGGENPGGEYVDEPASPTHEVRLAFLVYEDEQF